MCMGELACCLEAFKNTICCLPGSVLPWSVAYPGQWWSVPRNELRQWCVSFTAYLAITDQRT